MMDRGPAAGRLVVPASVGVVGLALILVGQTVLNRHAIEHDLTNQSTKALQSADLVGLSVSFTGRDATITGSGSDDLAQQATSVVSAVSGVRVAKVKLTGTTASSTGTPVVTSTASATPAASMAASPTPPVAAVPVGFTFANGTMTVTGTVPSDADRTALMSAATAAGHGWSVVDKVTVDSSVATLVPSTTRLPAVTGLLAGIPVDSSALVIQYNGTSVILRGAPANLATELAILADAAKTVDQSSDVIDHLDAATP